MGRMAEAFRAKYQIPGLSIAIARKGQLVYREAFGLADREARTRLETSHRFRIASVSKPITSVAIFDLIESRRLSLDDRVFGRKGVLGTTYGKAPYGPHIEDITIEHLLTHTGGGWRNDGRDPMFKHPRYNHAELIAWTLDTQPLTHAPGEAYGYSNFGYCVLGRVIETLTKRPYEAHVQERILGRCGVRGMSIGGNTLADRERDEVRYHDQAGEDPYTMNVRRMDSHGGWLATPADIVTFATHVDGFASPPDILSSRSITSMSTPVAASRGYAKGWQVNKAQNWWHTGSLPGTATLLVRTSGGFCWAAFTNTRCTAKSGMDSELDTMMWDMAKQIGA